MTEATMIPDGAADRGAFDEFVDLFYRQGQPRVALERFADAGYVQHSPGIGTGRDATIQAVERLFAAMPDIVIDVRRTSFDAGLGMVHSHFRPDRASRGFAVVDLFRFAGGRLVEHWDVIQEVPAEAANANGMT